jgi:hypothetical protein
MSERRRKIPKEIEEKVLIRSRRKCCLCVYLNRDKSVKPVQIAHIDHDRNNNELDNLVALCLNHHDAYDSKRSQSKNYTQSEIKHYRDKLDQLIYENDQGLKFPLTVSLETLLPEQPASDLSEENRQEVKSSLSQKKENPKVTCGYYHSGERRILLTGFEAEFYRTVVEGLLEQFVISEDLFKPDSVGSTWSDWERYQNLDGKVFPWIKTEVAAFDSLDVNVKKIVLKHVLDVLTNSSSNYPAFAYEKAPYYLAGEAFAVAPLWWLANYAIPDEIEMHQTEQDEDIYLRWRRLAWETWIRLTKSNPDYWLAYWMVDPKTDNPFIGFADNNKYLPLCPESKNQEAWRWIICNDIALWLLDVFDDDWQDISYYKQTQYVLPSK